MPSELMSHRTRLLFIVVFAIGLAYLEAAAVVFLRELFYPGGFALPSPVIPENYLRIEILREAAALVILGSVAALAGRGFWEHFGWFLTIFGVSEIFYYVWLKAATGWPDSLFTWDILALIPVPWAGPVIAPIVIALFMVVIGTLITIMHAKGYIFRPTGLTWAAVMLGTAVLLLSFWGHAETTLEQVLPESYPYWMLLLGLALYLVGFWHTWHVTFSGIEKSSAN